MTDQENNRRPAGDQGRDGGRGSPPELPELDVWRDRMVAALYGELPSEEEEELLTHLAHDPALRAEWDELRESRAFLREADAADADPGFVFEPPASAAARAAAGRPASRVGSWWLSLLARPATGFALAGIAAVILMIAGLRIDRVSGGLAVRFGRAVPAGPAVAEGARTPASPALVRAEGALAEDAGPGDERYQGGAAIEPGASGGDDLGLNAPVTRAELAAFAQQLVSATETRFQQQEDRYLGQTVFMLRDYHRASEEERLRDRREMTSEMNRALLALLQAGAWDGERLELPRGQSAGDSTPAAAPRTPSEEGVRHE